MPKRKKRGKKPEPKEQVVDYGLLWQKIKTNKLTIPICIFLLFTILLILLILLGFHNNAMLS